DGVSLLAELGAVDLDDTSDKRRLTLVGKRLARLPIDPRLGRMVLEAERLGCVREVTVIVAALSIQDPRERPASAREAAAEAHNRFNVEGSDLLALVKLWDYLREQQRELSSNQFRKLCRTEFLNYLRVREWQDVFRQVRQTAAAVGIHSGTDAGHPDRVHQALLAGLLSHIGMRDGTTREYRGARGSRFLIGRESRLSKNQPRWVMAAELVETNRLWARMVAGIKPEWAERAAAHLTTRSYGEPSWDPQRGAAVTTERVSLYGLPIVVGRRVAYERVNRAVARELFIREALVYRRWVSPHVFLDENDQRLTELRAMAERQRVVHLVDDDAVFAFYDQRIGAEVCSGRQFDQWWKRIRPANPELLKLSVADLVPDDGPAPDGFPTVWHQRDLNLEVTYRFEPGAAGDGATVHVPLSVLNRVTDDGFEWQVDGLREKLIAAVVKTLPKQLRRDLSPLSEAARQAYLQADPSAGRIADELARVLGDLCGRHVAPSDIDLSGVPDHLRIHFAIDDDDRTLATGTDLDALRRLLTRPLRETLAAATPGIERSGITTWDFGSLPRTVETVRGGLTVLGYPALLDDDDSVSIRVFTNAGIQERAMRSGVRRLLLLAVPVPIKALERGLTNSIRLAVAAFGASATVGRGSQSGAFTPASLAADCVVAAANRLLADNGGAVWDEQEFAQLCTAARRELAQSAAAALHLAGEIVATASRVIITLDRLIAPAVAPAADDMRAQLRRLVRPGFVAASGTARLDDVLRYVRAIERRADKLPGDPRRDGQRMGEVTALEERYRTILGGLPRGAVTAEVIDAGWFLEELRVSVFAQSLGTARPVSTLRVARVLAGLPGGR
ncbi:MAG: ATP-dependent RNA helicase HrpA, partial [Ilumatobacteraceae bacterium]